MRIAEVAPLYERVPPQLYGGTERIVSWLTEELVRRGHDVTLFASGDSETSARLIPPCDRAIRLNPEAPDPIALHYVELAEVRERAEDFDVVHFHVDYLAFPVARQLARDAGTKVVHTMHGALDRRHCLPVFRHFRDAPLVSISDSQRAPLAQLDLRWLATVHHGLPVDAIPYEPGGGAGGYLAFLGRLSPEKGPETAIRVAQHVGCPLRIAAKVDPADRSYFERVIRPYFEDPLIEYLGEINDAEKWKFLHDARCLVFPIEWEEPFGIAMIEALACGTPVIGCPRGSVPEVVRDGATGYLGDTVDDLAAAVKRVDVIDRAECRRDVETRFSVKVMTDRYEAVYRALVEGE